MEPSPEVAEVLRRIKWRTAVHEAAHAVVGHEIGWQVVFIEMSDMDFTNQHADQWAFTRCSVTTSRHDIDSVAQILAGHVAERLFARVDTDPDEDLEDPEDFYCVADDVCDYITELRDGDGDRGDFAAAWYVLDVNLDLPSADDLDNFPEREAAFAWAVLRTCRMVLPLRDQILRVAGRVDVLGPGERLDGSEILSVMDVCG